MIMNCETLFLYVDLIDSTYQPFLQIEICTEVNRMFYLLCSTQSNSSFFLSFDALLLIPIYPLMHAIVVTSLSEIGPVSVSVGRLKICAGKGQRGEVDIVVDPPPSKLIA